MTKNTVKIAGVRFRENSKVYDFEATDINVAVGDKVIVDSERGAGFAQVVRIKRAEHSIAEETPSTPPRVPVEHGVESDSIENETAADRKNDHNRMPKALRKILRKATADDEAQEEKNRLIEVDAFTIAQDMIAEREMPMKLIRVEYSFDASRATFFFFSETRVDFRELVKDLAHKLKSRIEMRQIGVRDVARLIGGFGPCGRELCCVSFLKNFEPVSIRMAKKQEMVLNPSKISGICGRLLCCLSYEYEMYDEIKKDIADLRETESKDKKQEEIPRIEEERHEVEEKNLSDDKKRQEDSQRKENQKQGGQESSKTDAGRNHRHGRKQHSESVPTQLRQRQQSQQEKSQTPEQKPQQPQQDGEKVGKKKRRRFWRKKKKGQQQGTIKPQGPEKA